MSEDPVMDGPDAETSQADVDESLVDPTNADGTPVYKKMSFISSVFTSLQYPTYLRFGVLGLCIAGTIAGIIIVIMYFAGDIGYTFLTSIGVALVVLSSVFGLFIYKQGKKYKAENM